MSRDPSATNHRTSALTHSSRPPVAPVIVLGMHRSGTTLVTQILQDAGLFVGKNLSRNREGRFFMDLNDWILSKCGGTWDMPHVVDVLQDFPEAKSAITAQLRRALRSPMARHYLGTTYWARHSTQAWLPFEWGWKDPRNTFTLPLWMELFPAAKIVNVERHGIDVALSLKRRLDNSLEVTLNREGRALSDLRLTSVRKLRCANGGFRCGDLRQGMRLWATYSQRARSHCMQLGDQALTVRFETLLDNPDPVVRELLDFAGLEGSQTARTAIARSLDPSKALAWKAIGDPQLKDLEEEFRHSLNELYY